MIAEELLVGGQRLDAMRSCSGLQIENLVDEDEPHERAPNG